MLGNPELVPGFTELGVGHFPGLVGLFEPACVFPDQRFLFLLQILVVLQPKLEMLGISFFYCAWTRRYRESSFFMPVPPDQQAAQMAEFL
jgi:hypothetical protein